MSKGQEFFRSHEAVVNEFNSEIDRVCDTLPPTAIVGMTRNDDLPDLWEGSRWDLANEDDVHDAADWISGATSRMGHLVLSAVGADEYSALRRAWRMELDKGLVLRRYGIGSITDRYFEGVGPYEKLSVRGTVVFPYDGDEPCAIQRTAILEEDDARRILDIRTDGTEILHIVTTTVPRAEELLERARLLLGKPLLNAMVPYINGSFISEEVLDTVLAHAEVTVRGQHSEVIVSPLLAELRQRAVTLHDGVVLEVENGWNIPDVSYFESILPYLRAA